MSQIEAGVKVHHVAELIAKYGDAATLADALADETAERDAAFTFACPDCAKTGTVPASKYGNDPFDSTPVTCPTCNGEGKTLYQKAPLPTTYVDVIP